MDPKVVLPMVVLGVASLGAGILIYTGSPVVGRPTERSLRAVRVTPVEIRTAKGPRLLAPRAI
jgi:hypothetical protein